MDGPIEPSPSRRAWQRFRRNWLAMAGLLVIALLVLVALSAPVLTGYSPTARADPGLPGRSGPSAGHWFGTDIAGRDLFTRVVYGTRISLRIGIVSVAFATAVGIAVGAAAGYREGVIDGLLTRITDMFLSIPLVLAGLVLASVAGRGERTVILVLALLGWMPVARLMRAGVLQAKQQPYVEAARAAGCGGWRIVVHHIVPNSVQPVVVYSTILVGLAVLAESSLSFLGVGVQPPAPAWGSMVAEGRGFLGTSPHLLFFPAAAVAATVTAFVLAGEGLRDALDTRMPAR